MKVFINSNCGSIEFSAERPAGFQDGDLRDILNAHKSEQVTCLLADAKAEYFRELSKTLEENELLDLDDVLSEHDWFADGLEELGVFENLPVSLEDFRDEQHQLFSDAKEKYLALLRANAPGCMICGGTGRSGQFYDWHERLWYDCPNCVTFEKL